MAARSSWSRASNSVVRFAMAAASFRSDSSSMALSYPFGVRLAIYAEACFQTALARDAMSSRYFFRAWASVRARRSRSFSA